jgi:hypothetical protein
MKILLEQQGRHVAMQIVGDKIIDGVDADWGMAIADIDHDLKGRQGVKRMSYDTWHWDLRRLHEAEEYITYFYLKHE